MKVRDVLRGRRLLTVEETDSLSLAAQMMAWGTVRHLPVTREGRLVGVLSERDVLRSRAVGESLNGLSRPVGEAMTRPPKTAAPDDDLLEVEARLSQEKIGCLPIVERGRLVGMLTASDLLGEHVGRGAAPSPNGGPVGAVMTRRPVVAKEDDRLLDAVERMLENGVRHLPVVDPDGRVVGMLSDRDVRTAVGDPRRALERSQARPAVDAMRVAEVMTRDPIAVDQDAPLQNAIEILVAEKVGALPVVDSREKLVGIVSYLDVLEDAARRLRARH